MYSAQNGLECLIRMFDITARIKVCFSAILIGNIRFDEHLTEYRSHFFEGIAEKMNVNVVVELLFCIFHSICIVARREKESPDRLPVVDTGTN